MTPYGETIYEHFKHPRNYGSLENPDIRHEDVNPFCGDRVRIELALREDGSIGEARFQGDLCMIAKASGSLLTEMITGQPLASVATFDQQKLLDALNAEIQPARKKCAMLALEVLQSGVRSWNESRRNE